MEPIWTLSFFSLAMFLGCYLAGSIPLLLTLSEKILRKVTVFGAGLLVGTALVVIIPEGIESLYSSSHSHHTHDKDGEVETSSSSSPPSFSLSSESASIGGEADNENLEFLLGLSLVLGFVFMLVIDQCGSHSHSSGTDVEAASVRRKGGITVTVGLVVHAAADGLALGAAAGLSKSDVEFVIFLAIMLHKAPAAFGFVTFLIHDGYDRKTARFHLLIFSLAAPLASFVSYFGLIRVMYSTSIPITGITMLFSAGTFLYVATVHVLNEISRMSPNSRLSIVEVILLVMGSLLPLLFNVTHSH
ncbi:PREDICTED: zinc transporter ZIP9-B-like [Amphimedon queenslandica]|uniref:Zinc/iron permease n=1 Tax=Amphimedon queenslandica TaxID=400682 RepID=A0A1X7UA66_AMPQE|nr:PREDICTED: zinc transporter ZIP9-B-like [Amphimedon queenslandica]|eukprot:XP_011405688.1 PREDICTED: zinc transporter ZIP9-B-like [Amphimedon queenslandica]